MHVQMHWEYMFLKKLSITLIMTAHKAALRDYGTQLWELDEAGRLKVTRVGEELAD